MSYTLIAYRPNSAVPACGRGCCGTNHYESKHSIERGLTDKELIEKIARFELEDEGYEGEESYVLTYFIDGSVMLPEDEIEWIESIKDHSHYRKVQLKNEARIEAEQKALEAAVAEERAAVQAQIQADKEREEYERSELVRLQAKYQSQPAPLVGFPDGD